MSTPGKDPNDPFAAFESDRTVIKPGAGRPARPGGAPAGGGGAPAGGMPQPAAGGGAPAGGGKEAPLSIDALMSANLNPLVAAAAPLLSAAPRIRQMLQHANPAGLKDALADGVRKFEAQARAEGLPNEQVIAGRYILCTLLDESAASTPWGGSGVWANQSLLVQFHNETWGGEKIFQLMSKLAENVGANRNLLELLYVVLAFGFEGRYRVVNDGKAQLDAVRTRLSQLLKQQRAQGADKALSPRWEGVPARTARLGSGVPMWVVMSAAALLLLLAYVGLRFSINGVSDDVFAALRGLDVKAAPVVAPPPPAPPAPPRLANLLKPDVDAQLLTVRDLADRSTIVIRGDGFFEPGSAVVSDKVLPLLGRISTALQAMPGTVMITGHTDNQPIRSLRYPSNWHLSQDRANAVKNVLATTLKPERMRAEGRADAEPVSDNGSPAGRAQNRRVEITLFLAAGGA